MAHKINPNSNSFFEFWVQWNQETQFVSVPEVIYLGSKSPVNGMAVLFSSAELAFQVRLKSDFFDEKLK